MAISPLRLSGRAVVIGGLAFASACSASGQSTQIEESIPTQSQATEKVQTATLDPPTPPATDLSGLEIRKLQSQLSAAGIETEIAEQENGDLVFSHLLGARSIEIGTFVNRGGGYEFEVIKLNGKPSFFSLGSLVFNSETDRFSILDENGSKLFVYYHEIGRWRELADFPYLTLSSPNGRVQWIVGESLDAEVNSLAWNTQVPDLEYKDLETGEIRSLTPEQRFQEAVYLAYWSLAKASDPNITLEQIKQGTTFTYEDNEEKIQTVDTSQPFRFMWTKTTGPGKRYDFLGVGYWVEVDNAGGMTVYTQGTGVYPGSFEVWAILQLMIDPNIMAGEYLPLTSKEISEKNKILREFALLLQDLDPSVWENPRFIKGGYNAPRWGYLADKAISIIIRG